MVIKNLKNRLRHALRNGDGFTYVELLATLVVSGIVMTLVATLLYSQWRSWEAASNRTLLANDLQFSANFIEEKVRQATTLPTVTIDTSVTPNAQLLTVNTGGGNYLFSIAGTTLRYSKDGGTSYTSFLSAGESLDSGNSSFALSGNNVTITLKGNIQGTTGNQTMEMKTTVQPRMVDFR